MTGLKLTLLRPEIRIDYYVTQQLSRLRQPQQKLPLLRKNNKNLLKLRQITSLGKGKLRKRKENSKKSRKK